ncbi:MAG: hypothetical protein AB8F94_16725 [Saprospiraceae bacterium]
MKTLICIPLFFLLLTSGCKQYYTVANFEEKTQAHQTIAVLPFEMVYTGIPPKELTEDDIQRIEISESKAFQSSFFNAILASSRQGRNQLRVDFQHYSKTLNLLKDNGIDIRDSWGKDPAELAKILGVDAVVKAQIEKRRYMSDLASYGIEAGTQIIGAITNNRILPFVNNRNKTVRTDYTIVNQEDGNVLWSIAYDFDANWRSTSEDIIETINARSARRFPYRVD